MASTVDITLPTDLAEGTETVVATWFKAPGEAVSVNEPLLEISTDKVTVEIAAPATGVLHEILKSDGDAVELGDILGRIAVDAAAPAAPTAASAPATAAPARTPATGGGGSETADRSGELSPAVRRLVAEHGLDPALIAGTGRGGRITVADVEAHLAGSAKPAAAGGPAGRRVPHGTMRKSIAQHMTESLRAAPHVTTVFEADLTAVLADRERRREALERDGVRLTLTAYFARATVEAIRAVPETNARWHADALELWDEVNLGIATALEDGGLIVPVVRGAHDLDLVETARRVQDLSERARAGTLTPKEVRDGTFTISNHGVSGSLIAAPIIINQPQSAILGVGKLQRRVVAAERDGGNGGYEPVIRPMVYVTLTIDHRVLDGHRANAFLTRWVSAIEGWS